MMEAPYYLFTKEDPIDRLVTNAKKIPISRRWKAAPLITRARVFSKKSQSFRDILTQEKSPICELIAVTFTQYFDRQIDNGRFVVIPKDPSYDFIKFLSTILKKGVKMDDKYLKKATNLTLQHSDAIDAFVKAFHSIRMAEDMVNKLQSS